MQSLCFKFGGGCGERLLPQWLLAAAAAATARSFSRRFSLGGGGSKFPKRACGINSAITGYCTAQSNKTP